MFKQFNVITYIISDINLDDDKAKSSQNLDGIGDVLNNFLPAGFMKVRCTQEQQTFEQFVDSFLLDNIAKGGNVSSYKILWYDYSSFNKIKDLMDLDPPNMLLDVPVVACGIKVILTTGELKYHFWLSVPEAIYDIGLEITNTRNSNKFMLLPPSKDRESIIKLQDQVNERIKSLLEQAGYEVEFFSMELTAIESSDIEALAGVATMKTELLKSGTVEEIKEFKEVVNRIISLVIQETTEGFEVELQQAGH